MTYIGDFIATGFHGYDTILCLSEEDCKDVSI